MSLLDNEARPVYLNVYLFTYLLAVTLYDCVTVICASETICQWL